MTKASDKAAAIDDLSKFADGLYFELDKLSKKDPYAQVSALAARRLNRALGDAKELLSGDRYLADIEVQDADDEDLEARDAVLILQEIRKAIQRAEAAENRRIFGA